MRCPPATLAVLLIISITYILASLTLYSSMSPIFVHHPNKAQYVQNESNIHQVMEYDVIEPWFQRFHGKRKRRKSRFLAECPSELNTLLNRDRVLQTNIYTPSKYTNYTALKHHFWNHMVSSQQSQLNHPNTLIHGTRDMTSRLEDNHCSYKGRVFGIGLYKTGTTSLSLSLSYLGYIDHDKTSIYKWLKPYGCIYSHWFLILRHFYDFMHSVCSINNNDLLFDIFQRSQRSFNFGDVPMLYFWPFFLRWYPNSKYILTQRNSTAKYVNSVMKFCIQLQECMHWKFADNRYWWQRLFAKNINHDSDIAANITLHEYKWNEDDEINGADIAHYIAMIYELHNQRIIEYFTRNHKLNDLLIINIDECTDYDLWKQIMAFVGCDNHRILNIKFPHVNPTEEMFTQIKLIPDHYPLDWKTYFKHQIPIMMATHTPNRKIWFEYQDGDYQQLL